MLFPLVNRNRFFVAITSLATWVAVGWAVSQVLLPSKLGLCGRGCSLLLLLGSSLATWVWYRRRINLAEPSIVPWGSAPGICNVEVAEETGRFLHQDADEDSPSRKAVFIGRLARTRLKFNRYTDPTDSAVLQMAESMVGNLLSDPDVCPTLRRTDRVRMHPVAVAAALVPTYHERLANAVLAQGAIQEVIYDLKRARFCRMPIPPERRSWWDRLLGRTHVLVECLPQAGKVPF